MTGSADLPWLVWAVALLALLAGLELSSLLGLRPASRRLREVLRKVPRVLPTAAASDHWKQRAAMAYSGRLLISGIQAGAALLPAAALPLSTLRLFTGDWERAFDAGAEPVFILACLMTGSTWWWLRRVDAQR